LGVLVAKSGDRTNNCIQNPAFQAEVAAALFIYPQTALSLVCGYENRRNKRLYFWFLSSFTNLAAIFLICKNSSKIFRNGKDDVTIRVKALLC
jgi:hypothetical protein